MILYIYVQPNSSKTEFAEEILVDSMKFGIPDEEEVKATKIKLAAPPVDGEANKELIKFFAKHYKVAKSSVSIIKGKKSKYKVVEIFC